MNSLRVVEHSSETAVPSTTAEFSASKTCSICISDYQANDTLVELPCKHRYHKDCIIPWLQQHRKCPICNVVIHERTAQPEQPRYEIAMLDIA